jgi:pyruvate dehydrogenase E1 component alpha subunit
MKILYTAEELIAFEKKVADEFEKGTINCPIHLSGGNEEELRTIFGVVEEKDYIVSTHRSHYHYLLKGGSPDKLMAEIKGQSNGCCGGKGRSMHIMDKSINFYSSAIVAGGCAIAVGIALGIKKKYPDRTKKRPNVFCFVGDGAEDSGFYIEAVRFGLSRQLPLQFVVEDNDYAVESTKVDRWHNFTPVQSPNNVNRYCYVRTYPHVGVGKYINF